MTNEANKIPLKLRQFMSTNPEVNDNIYPDIDNRLYDLLTAKVPYKYESCKVTVTHHKPKHSGSKTNKKVNKTKKKTSSRFKLKAMIKHPNLNKVIKYPNLKKVNKYPKIKHKKLLFPVVIKRTRPKKIDY